jgi:hypothetical protein
MARESTPGHRERGKEKIGAPHDVHAAANARSAAAVWSDEGNYKKRYLFA